MRVMSGVMICILLAALDQTVVARGATAAQSGLYLAPFMLASAVGNVAGSRYARRFGTMRRETRIAGFLCCTGLIVLAVQPALSR